MVTDLDQILTWHLLHNHCPPIPRDMIPVCKAAIAAVNERGDWDELVPLPEWTTWKGDPSAPAAAIIVEFHLDEFLE
jgi:hypothetical protein